LKHLISLATVLWVLSLALACSSSKIESSTLEQRFPSPSLSPKAEAAPSPTGKQPIRLIDFDNISYPHYPVYTDMSKRYVTLKAGEGGPAMLNYGDVTGDGVEEAMMMLGIENRGSAIPEIVYIFGMSKGGPKLLWWFETGDRADGGLRQVYAENEELVVELYGKDRIIGSDLYRGDEGLCCPSTFTQARYEWRSNRFRLKGQPEVLPNPAGHGSAVMPQYFGPAK
jgi:hypothetical protein